MWPRLRPRSFGVRVVLNGRGKHTRAEDLEVLEGVLEIGGVKNVVAQSRSIACSSLFPPLVRQEIRSAVPRVSRMPLTPPNLRNKKVTNTFPQMLGQRHEEGVRRYSSFPKQDILNVDAANENDKVLIVIKHALVN